MKEETKKKASNVLQTWCPGLTYPSLLTLSFPYKAIHREHFPLHFLKKKKKKDETDSEFKPRGQVPSLKSGVIKVQPAGQVWGSRPPCVKFYWDTLTFSDIVHMVAFTLQQS